MWIPAALLWMLNLSSLCSGQDYTDYYQTGDVGTQAPDLSDDQPSLETVTSMDQLIQLFYPQHSLVQHCMRKKSWRASSSSPSFSTSSTSPLSRPGSEDFWVPLREEALYRVDGTLGVILEEIQRTSCLPREVCVEVAKEYPQSTSQFYLPRCVSLHRCGGCCTNEAFYCTNTSFTLVNKTLMELSPPRMDRSVAMVTFVNHTSCECLSKRPLHSIIRRSAPDHLCSPPERPCASGSLWDPLNCMCVSVDAIGFSQREMEMLDSSLLALCGPNRVLDESTCDCICQNGLTEQSCDPGWKLDRDSCECQCEGRGEGKFCPAGQRWDDELCGCVCAADCPRNQPLNPDTCLCECRESPQSCLRQGMRFNSSTCRWELRRGKNNQITSNRSSASFRLKSKQMCQHNYIYTNHWIILKGLCKWGLQGVITSRTPSIPHEKKFSIHVISAECFHPTFYGRQASEAFSMCVMVPTVRGRGKINLLLPPEANRDREGRLRELHDFWQSRRFQRRMEQHAV